MRDREAATDTGTHTSWACFRAASCAGLRDDRVAVVRDGRVVVEAAGSGAASGILLLLELWS